MPTYSFKWYLRDHVQIIIKSFNWELLWHSVLCIYILNIGYLDLQSYVVYVVIDSLQFNIFVVLWNSNYAETLVY